MKAKSVKLSEIKVNPNNPQLIKDDKFAKLVQSIKDLPQMLAISIKLIKNNAPQIKLTTSQEGAFDATLPLYNSVKTS